MSGLAAALMSLIVLAPAQDQTARQKKIEELKRRQLEQTTAVVKGRCIDAETGEPMAGCNVEFDGRPSNDEMIALHGKPDWTDPEPTVTGDDGRFEFRFIPPPPFQHSMNIEADGRYPRTARWRAFKPGQTDDLGDIEMRRGVIVTGRVVDTEGRPVAKVSVGIRDLCLPISTPAGEQPDRRRRGEDRWAENAMHYAANDMRYGFTGEDGTFQTTVPVPPGSWPLRVSRRGLKSVRPEELTVRHDMAPIEIVVDPPAEQPSIQGIVVDKTGKPVHRVWLEVTDPGSNRASSAVTRKDGTFTMRRPGGAATKTAKIRVFDPADCEPVQPVGPYAWGKTGVKIVLDRALSFPLTVVEAGSGKPVEHFAVQAHATRATSSLHNRVRLGGHHQDGEVIVDRIWRGENVLMVIPQDDQLAISEKVFFTATDENPGPQRVELVRMTPLKLTVIDAGGAPVVRAKVELIRPGTRPFQPDDRALSRTRRGAWSSNPRHRFPECYSEIVTDKYGQGWVYGVPDMDFLARVTLPDGSFHIETDVVVGKRDARDIRVDT